MRLEDPLILERRQPIETLALQFCEAHLNAEYKRLVKKLLDAIQKQEPYAVVRGDAKIWAAGLIHALGSSNFLFDPGTKPHVKLPQIAAYFGVRVGSMTQRSTMIQDLVGLHQLDERFATKANQKNIAEMNGMMADAISLLTGVAPSAVAAEMPHLGRRKSSKTEFLDREREVMSDFYEFTERAERMRAPQIEKGLRALIKRDPDFLDSYLMLRDLLKTLDRNDEEAVLREEAYRRALGLITDKKGAWPQNMDWGWLENRHIIRALDEQATHYWQNGQHELALDILRKLLKSNPHDNIGARNSILALRLGLDFDSWDEPFRTPDGYLAARPLFEWFERESKRFPEEFAVWKEAVSYDEE